MITTILAVLAFFLWVSGGIGWINFYEVAEDTEFNLTGKAIVMVTWPLMAIVAMVTQIWDETRYFGNELRKFVRDKTTGE